VNDYPMLHVVMRWGGVVAAVLALMVAACALWAAAAGGHWVWGAAGVILAGVGYGVALSYVELVRLIVDMLLPKP
jgi:hypothetical protein